jgi:hypothetical protein
MQAMEELGCFLLPGIVYRSLRHPKEMLKHEVLAVDEWHLNGPQDLITVSQCIGIVIDKMQLAYICPYHNPNASMGYSVHKVDISKLLTHTKPYIIMRF